MKIPKVLETSIVTRTDKTKRHTITIPTRHVLTGKSASRRCIPGMSERLTYLGSISERGFSKLKVRKTKRRVAKIYNVQPIAYTQMPFIHVCLHTCVFLNMFKFYLPYIEQKKAEVIQHHLKLAY